MARKKLFEFMKDCKKVEVFTGDGTADVYFKAGNGSVTSAGLRYNAEYGNFTSANGSTVKYDDAEGIIMKKV
jgi:hypothetical protein